MIVIIDYEMGNVRSVFNALTYLDADVTITSEQTKIDESSHIILPGVGAFGVGMENLHRKGLVQILSAQVKEKRKPFLGICLGMQLLARKSYELGEHEGLGFIDCEVVEFDLNGHDLKKPHVGWNGAVWQKEHPLLQNLPHPGADFYFVHSYHLDHLKTESLLATCDYGYSFPAAAVNGNVAAVQFHPEKSQDNGLQFLKNFLRWKP